MAEVSREVIVMIESEKINRKIPNLEIPWQQVHTLITDDDLSLDVRNKLIKQGINLICAK
jgi:DeoR/GlpR family transcriptional regulator of sugar metabolism